MKRYSDEKFINSRHDKDKVIALRVKNGEFYFIGWMEDAENYAMQIAKNVDSCELCRDTVVGMGDIYVAITNCEGYNNVYNISQSDSKDYINEYEMFLSFVKPYERNGVSDGDHDIFILSKDEFSSISDALRDGDYVFMLLED